MGPVVLMNEHDKGGHFAAWEVPEALVGDVRECLGKVAVHTGVWKGEMGMMMSKYAPFQRSLKLLQEYFEAKPSGED